MAEIAPMLGAIFGTKHTPKKAAAKSKSKSAAKMTPIVVHTESPLANAQEKPMSEHKVMKEHAKRELRHATESWISGHMTTKEHSAVHARAKHVLCGKRPQEFKGTSGERKMKFK